MKPAAAAAGEGAPARSIVGTWPAIAAAARWQHQERKTAPSMLFYTKNNLTLKYQNLFALRGKVKHKIPIIFVDIALHFLNLDSVFRNSCLLSLLRIKKNLVTLHF